MKMRATSRTPFFVLCVFTIVFCQAVFAAGAKMALQPPDDGQGGGASASSDPPTLISDKASYLPGDNIIFSGTNWAPGEAVAIVVNVDAGGTVLTVQATADDSGSLNISGIMPDVS